MLQLFLFYFFLAVFAYGALSVIYVLTLAVAGRFFYRPVFSKLKIEKPQHSFAVLVPSFKEDAIIIATAKNLLQLNYPRQLYDVYIIADGFEQKTIDALRQMPLNVIEVSFEKSTKAKALNHALATINKEYDLALICDADNLLKPDFLNKIDQAFMQGAEVVQGKRVAKNVENALSALDGASESINNNLFRKGGNALGLSSSLIGSGMAFRYAYFKTAMAEIDAVGGFDKKLQLHAVGLGKKIIYLEDAIVYDEKVEDVQAFNKQRSRWVSTQYIYVLENLPKAFRLLIEGNISYFMLAVVNNLLLPRSVLLLFLPVLLLAAAYFSIFWALAVSALIVLYAVALLLALDRHQLNARLLGSLARVPGLTLIMAGAFFRVRKSNKVFLHTAHKRTEISNKAYEANH